MYGTDGKGEDLAFTSVKVAAPFPITDIDSFKKACAKAIIPELHKDLSELNRWAFANLKLYENFEGRQAVSGFAYYTINADGRTVRRLGEKGLSVMVYKPQAYVILLELNDFCRQLSEITTDYLEGIRIQSLLALSQPVRKGYPDKWYALYHMILIAIGKPVPNLSDYTKAEKIKYGENQYGTGQDFYREFKVIDLNNITAYVRSLPPKDRKDYKKIITAISGNDADVISWLRKQPK